MEEHSIAMRASTVDRTKSLMDFLQDQIKKTKEKLQHCEKDANPSVEIKDEIVNCKVNLLVDQDFYRVLVKNWKENSNKIEKLKEQEEREKAEEVISQVKSMKKELLVEEHKEEKEHKEQEEMKRKLDECLKKYEKLLEDKVSLISNLEDLKKMKKESSEHQGGAEMTFKSLVKDERISSGKFIGKDEGKEHCFWNRYVKKCFYEVFNEYSKYEVKLHKIEDIIKAGSDGNVGFSKDQKERSQQGESKNLESEGSEESKFRKYAVRAHVHKSLSNIEDVLSTPIYERKVIFK